MKEGFNIPNIIFKIRVRDESVGGPNPYRWSETSTADLFNSKRVVVFSLPGAFTPTCSTYQLPGFEQAYDQIRNLGVDEVYVISVNDAFVMNNWARQQEIKNIKTIPDGNGEFTRRMGMLIDKSNLGFGMRSWRYAAIINDGVVEKWFEEAGCMDNCEDDPYEVTTPENIVKYLSV